MLRARRRWKDPVKVKELGVLLRLRGANTWIERTSISSRDRRGQWNHKGYTRYDNGLMIEAWEVSADFDMRDDAARKLKE